MKKIFKALKITSISALVLFAFIACDKDFNTLGSDIIGEKNFNTESELFSAISYNKKLNPVQTNGLPSNLLGIYNDPVYGQTTASIVTQVTPTFFDPTFGENPEIDEVILTIPYFSRVTGTDEEGNVEYTISDSLYGDPEAQFKLSIYQNNFFLRDFDPNSELDEAQEYYSNSNETINFDLHQGELLYGPELLTPSADAVVITSGEGDDATEERLTPRLRAVLDNNDFWKTLIFDKEGQPELSNANNFEDYFRGLYFKAEMEGVSGNMIMLNLATSDANITINYSSGEEDSRVQNTYVLNFTENRVNTFTNNFSVTLVDGDNVNGDEKLYLKGGEGSMTIIDLFGGEDSPELTNFKALRDSWLINEANLVVYEDETVISATDESHDNDRLYLYDLKNNTPIIDYFFDSSDNVIDPTFSKIIHSGRRDVDEETGVAKYKIRVTEHVKNLLRDSTNTKLGLVLSNNVNLIQNSTIFNSAGEAVTEIPTATVVSPKGTVLYGSNASVPENRRIQLEVFYTEAN